MVAQTWSPLLEYKIHRRGRCLLSKQLDELWNTESYGTTHECFRRKTYFDLMTSIICDPPPLILHFSREVNVKW